MKIVYLIASLRKAGPVNVLYDIVSNIDMSKHDVYIIKFFKDEIGRSIYYRFIELGINVIDMHFTHLKFEFCFSRLSKFVEKEIEKICPDIIHTHGYHAALIASKISHWKRIDTLHCICKDDFVYSKGLILGRYMIFRYLNALKKLDGCVAISKSVKAAYSSVLPEKKISLVYNGCDINLYTRISEEKKQSLRIKLNLPIEAKIFVVVGALSKLKDPLTIVDAFLLLEKMQKRGNAFLIFVGKGELTNRCVKKVGNNDFIRFVGYKMNALEYLQASDFSICASHSEGFGLNFVESLLAGTPVIGSDIPPFCEFTENSEALSRLQFKVGNSESLSEKIILSMNTNIEMDEVIKDIKSRFSAKVMSESYQQLYNDIIYGN